MDKHTIYSTISGMVGACLAVIFFLILFGRIDVVNLVGERSLGGATALFEMHYVSAADAKAYVTEFIEGSPLVFEQKLNRVAANIGVTAVASDDVYIHSMFRYNGGRCVRIGIVDDDTTMQAGRVYLFVDSDGIVHVENDC